MLFDGNMNSHGRDAIALSLLWRRVIFSSLVCLSLGAVDVVAVACAVVVHVLLLIFVPIGKSLLLHLVFFCWSVDVSTVCLSGVAFCISS